MRSEYTIFFCFFMLVIIICACGGNKHSINVPENYRLYSEEYYPSGDVKKYAIKRADTVKIFGFHADGKKESEIDYYNSNKSEDSFCGYIIWYFESGVLKSEASFYNGVKHGTERNYYANGEVRDVKNYFGGKLFGQAYKRPDSLTGMQEYHFYNFNSQPVCKIEYSANGNVVSEKGSPYAIAYNNNDLKISDSFRLSIFVGELKNTTFSLAVTEGDRVLKKIESYKDLNEDVFGRNVEIAQ